MTQAKQAIKTTQQQLQLTPAQQQHIGQGTAIEQSRATADSQMAMLSARTTPRDLDRVLADVERSCSMPEMAERAFFSLRKGGQSVTGASVHLARELARAWGNMSFGIKELRRDDELHESEIMAYAWDLETNARCETTMIVKHERWTRGGNQPLQSTADIYENNQARGARALREQIFGVLPRWLVERAKRLCWETIQNGGGIPLQDRIDRMIDAYKSIGVTRRQIEKYIGEPATNWRAQDVAAMGVLFTSIQQGERSVEDIFPRKPEREETTPEALTGAAASE